MVTHKLQHKQSLQVRSQCRNHCRSAPLCTTKTMCTTSSTSTSKRKTMAGVLYCTITTLHSIAGVLPTSALPCPVLQINCGYCGVLLGATKYYKYCQVLQITHFPPSRSQLVLFPGRRNYSLRGHHLAPGRD